MDMNWYFRRLKIEHSPIYNIVYRRMTTYLEIGTSFLETLWFSYASRILENAIEVYKLDEAVAMALREKFLKRGDYVVVLRE
uniref:Uncharacterized protein n=1 Tax=viral metagenome TaxID=1070528 RepID=A0A6C0K893_9ZZZZ